MKYCIAVDDFHYYIIPFDKIEEWKKFIVCHNVWDDIYPIPQWAEKIDNGLCYNNSFENWKQEK